MSSDWDNWCHLRANSPSRRGWRWLVVVVLSALGFAAAVAWYWFW